MTELTTRKKVDNPLFNFTVFNIKSGTDDTALVQSAIQLDYNLISPVVINDFKFPNVSCSNVAIANGATNVECKVRNTTCTKEIDRLRECEWAVLEVYS